MVGMNLGGVAMISVPIIAFSASHEDVPSGDTADTLYVISPGDDAAVEINARTVGFFYMEGIFNSDKSKLAVHVEDTGTIDGQVYVMDADGANEVAVVTQNGCDQQQWVDGDSALIWRRNGTSIKRIDLPGPGSGTTIVSATTIDSFHVSPDQSRVAYIRDNGADFDLRLMDTDGSNDSVLVASVGSVVASGGPVWLPDGSRIIYPKVVSGTGELHSIKPDGTDDQTLATPFNVGFWDHRGVMQDRLFYTDTTAHPVWNMGVLVFGSAPALVSPTLRLSLAVQRGIPICAGGRVYTVTQPGGGDDLMQSILPDGSDLRTHFTPDQSGTPLFEIPFMRVT